MSHKLLISLMTFLLLQEPGYSESVQLLTLKHLSSSFVNDLSLFFKINQRQVYSVKFDDLTDDYSEDEELLFEDEFEEEELELSFFDEALNEEESIFQEWELMYDFETVAEEAALVIKTVPNNEIEIQGLNFSLTSIDEDESVSYYNEEPLPLASGSFMSENQDDWDLLFELETIALESALVIKTVQNDENEIQGPFFSESIDADELNVYTNEELLPLASGSFMTEIQDDWDLLLEFETIALESALLIRTVPNDDNEIQGPIFSNSIDEDELDVYTDEELLPLASGSLMIEIQDDWDLLLEFETIALESALHIKKGPNDAAIPHTVENEIQGSIFSEIDEDELDDNTNEELLPLTSGSSMYEVQSDWNAEPYLHYNAIRPESLLRLRDIEEALSEYEEKENTDNSNPAFPLSPLLIAEGRHEQTIGSLDALSIMPALATENHFHLSDVDLIAKAVFFPKVSLFPILNGKNEETSSNFYASNKMPPLLSDSFYEDILHEHSMPISDITPREHLNAPHEPTFEQLETGDPAGDPLDDHDALPRSNDKNQDPFSLSGKSATIGREIGINAYSAVLDPQQKTGLFAQITYPVVKIWKRMGDRFEKGEILIQLDDSVAKGNYDRAEAVLEEAFSKFTATGALYKSQLSSFFELKEAEAEVAKAKAELTLAEANLKATQVAAPYSGIVDTVFIAEYELPQTGKEMIKILNDEVLIAKILVPSKLLPYLNVGTPFFIYLSEINGTIEAKISRIGGMIDAASSTLKLEAEIDNQGQRYKAGISGIASFDIPMQTDANYESE